MTQTTLTILITEKKYFYEKDNAMVWVCFKNRYTYGLKAATEYHNRANHDLESDGNDTPETLKEKFRLFEINHEKGMAVYKFIHNVYENKISL